MRPQTLAVCLSLCVFGISAQGQDGVISGTITDLDGKAVANARVQAKNQAEAQFQAKATATGTYLLTQLPAGTYQIMVVSPGLAPFEKKDVQVHPGETARVDARLQDFPSLGAVGEDRAFYADIFEPHHGPTGPAPLTPDGHPDFSGMWHSMRFVDPGKPEMLPWAEALTKERQANNMKDSPSSRCLPYGIILEALFFGFRIMQNSTLVALLFADDLPREIFLDGRKHPEEPLSPFVGHSVGHWEGDTLVVDTVGFNDKTWLDLNGHPHTDKMHVTERFRRKDLGHLEVEITIDDPGAYKTPWTIKRAAELLPVTEEIGQYVCTENNRDLPHLVGK